MKTLHYGPRLTINARPKEELETLEAIPPAPPVIGYDSENLKTQAQMKLQTAEELVAIPAPPCILSIPVEGEG